MHAIQTAGMRQGLQFAMLLSDGFGGFGGIAQFNRDFLESLAACQMVTRIDVLPRLLPNVISETIPNSVVHDFDAARGKFAFMKRVLAHACSSNRIDVVVCGHLHLLPAAWLLARVRKARLALIIHGIEAWQPTGHLLTNVLVRSVESIIAVSHHSAERFLRWSKVPKTKVYVMPNCVDLDRFCPQERDPLLVSRYGLQASKVILTVGRLVSEERQKGFDEVIEIMPTLLKRFPNLKYLIVGEGPDALRLSEKAKELRVSDQVIFTGRIPESEKVAHYNLADAYVMPSSGEGFGIVFIEAAACGLPIVGSVADGSREALQEGRLGRLVHPGKPEEIINATISVLENSSPKTQIEALQYFSVNSFRTRTIEWVKGQMAAHTL